MRRKKVWLSTLAGVVVVLLGLLAIYVENRAVAPVRPLHEPPLAQGADCAAPPPPEAAPPAPAGFAMSEACADGAGAAPAGTPPAEGVSR